MNDIVKRLRALSPPFECLHGAPYEVAAEAADEIERQQADIDMFMSERSGWLQEIEQLRAALKLARCYMPVGAEIYDSDIQSAVDFVESALEPKIQK